MANKSILAGKDVQLFINHTVFTEGEEWMAVCATNLGMEESSNENTTITKCETFTTAGVKETTITLDLVFVKGTPAIGEITAKIIKKIARDGSDFTWRITDGNPSGAEVNDSGAGIITSISHEYPAENSTTMSVTIKVNGPITDSI